jgi:predicted metal-dependent enzyme (double-stranded beta helix superfamily)
MPEEQGSKFGIDQVKTLIDVAWKVGTVLYFIFQFYNNQDQLIKQQAAASQSLIETRRMVDELTKRVDNLAATTAASDKAREQEMQFWMQVNPHKR